MIEFIKQYIVYALCLVLSIYGMQAIDFNRFIKKGAVLQAWTLYGVILMALTYLSGNFILFLISNV